MDDESAFFETFTYDYLVDFLLPVATLCLTLLSIMVELQQVINLCLDFDDEDLLPPQPLDEKKDKKVNEQLDLNLVWNDNSDDTFFESIIGYLWTFLWDNLKYICCLERILFVFFFGKLTRLREKGKIAVWVLVVTIPFYLQASMLFYYLGKSLEHG